MIRAGDSPPGFAEPSPTWSSRWSGLLIGLNTASADEFDAVPQRKSHGFEIVRYREERRRFHALRQLDKVPGLAGKWDGAEVQVHIG